MNYPHLIAALEYAARGWFVLPLHTITSQGCSCGQTDCKSPGKHPAIPNGQNDASNLSETIHQWWSCYPWNVGIVTAPSGLVVVDVDPRNGGFESLAKFNVEPTLTVATGGGGYHYYYQRTNDYSYPGKLAQGIDLISNGLVVAPPSFHISGQPYAWITPPETNPTNDPWLQSVLPQPEKRKIAYQGIGEGYALATLCGVCDDIRQLQPGEREKELSRKAFKIGGLISMGQLDEETSYQQLLEACPIAEDFPEGEASYTIEKAFKDALRHSWKLPAESFDPDLKEPGKDWTELSLARRTIQLLEHHRKTPDIINTEGDIWSWQQDHWQPLDESDLQIYLKWHGATQTYTNGNGKPKVKKLDITANKATSINKLIRCETLQERFFTKQDVQGIPFKNGYLIGDVLYDHSPNNKNTYCLPHSYDACADTTFFDQWFEKFWPDPSVQRVILEYFGAAAFGVTADYEKAMILVGRGANGKSTLACLLENMFDHSQVTSINPSKLGQEYYRALLKTSKLNLVTDLKASRFEDTGDIKTIISGEGITARRIYEKPVLIYPRVANLFCANRLPITEDSSKGWQRRWLVVPCEVAIPGGQEIVTFSKRLLAPSNYPGFLRRVVEGGQRLFAQGKFSSSANVQAATKEWLYLSDQVSMFLEECCVVDSGSFVTSKQLYSIYLTWASSQGLGRLSKRNLTTRIEEIGHKQIRRNHGRGYQFRVTFSP